MPPLSVAVGLLACAAGCSSGGAPAGTGATASSAASLSQARAIVARTVVVNNRANSRLDATLLHSFESGSAYSIDAAVYTMSKRAHETAGLSPFGIRVRSLSVPLRSGAPRPFAVLGTSYPIGSHQPVTSSACNYMDPLLVFQRPSPGSPYDIVLEPTVDARAVGGFASAAGGYAAAVPAAEQSVAGALPGQVAHDLEHYEVSGSLGPFTRSDFTGTCWSVPDPRVALKTAEQANLSARELFRPTGEVASFLLTGGRTIVIFTLSYSEQLVPLSSSRSIAWTSRPKQSLPSVLLPTGHYSRITENGEVEIAAVLTPGAVAGRFRLVGDYPGVTSIVGTRSSAPPGSSGPSGGSGPAGPTGPSGGQLLAVHAG